MEKRPKYLIIFALSFFIYPFLIEWLSQIYQGYPLAVAFSRISIAEMEKTTLIAFFVAGTCLYICRKWSFYLFFAAAAYLLFAYAYNFIALSGSMGIFPLVMLALATLTIPIYFLFPENTKVYFDPRVRWWEHEPRYKAETPMEFEVGDKTFSGKMDNFSMNGALLLTDAPPAQDTEGKIRFRIFDQDHVFVGKAVRLRTNVDTSVGLQFIHSDSSKKEALSICGKLRKDGKRMKLRHGRRSEGLLGKLFS